MTAPASERDRPCEFLGTEHDRWTRTSIPWPGHRCYAKRTGSEIARVQQGLFCLTANHVNCPAYVLAVGMRESTEPLPAPPAARPRWRLPALLSGGFLLRVGLIAAVVLFVISLEASLLRPFTRTTVQSQPMTTPHPTVTTYTLFPPTRPSTPPAAPSTATVTPNPTPSPTPSALSRPPLQVDPPADSQPRMTMAPSSGPRGSRVTISGANWTPGGEIAIRWGPAPSEEGMSELARTRAGPTGAFVGSVHLPEQATGTIYVSIRQGDRAAYVPFRVEGER
ncbi:MAG: hypothetical protein RMM58_02305 [Chloroflexota bacterium]|nr:hypothetical protein [Dehalococcoidia bacterium]MDW8252689.1 hypothetical protein [Chloroflexota bacterium]